MPNPDASTIGEVLLWQAAHRPDKRAFLFLERGERETESFTFAELDGRARAIAQTLQEHDLGGRRVILAYPSGLEFVAALFGCFYAGAIAVPAPFASHGHALARIHTIVEDAEAAAVLSLRSSLITELQIPDVACIATDEIASSGRLPASACRTRRSGATAIHLRFDGQSARRYAHPLEPDPQSADSGSGAG